MQEHQQRLFKDSERPTVAKKQTLN